MMIRRPVIAILSVVIFLLDTFLIGASGLRPAAAQGPILVTSQPDEAALYLGDLAYLRDTLTLPAGQDVHIALPASILPQSLIISEGGERIQNYRFISPREGIAQPSVTWQSPAGEEPREITLEYLATGAGWSPLYDMTVLADDQSQFGFDAEIRSTGLALDSANVRLIAAMPGAQPGYQPDMTMTQANVGYFDVNSGAAAGGPIQVQHVYEVGAQTLEAGDVVRHSVLYEPLGMRRLLVWDARLGQRVDVIYKVQNTTEVPFVEGPVRVYQDGLYIGQDQIEWTPAGSEGSVTAAGLSDIRVRRTESVEVQGNMFQNERYFHTVTLDINNHSSEEITLTVLDEWNAYGTQFMFSHEPQRQGNNVLRWELTIPAGEQEIIEYTFYTE